MNARQTQLTELNARSRAYSAQIWQLPLAYLTAAGVVLSQVSNPRGQAMASVSIGLVGLLLSWHLWGIEEGRSRAVRNLRDLETQLGLTPTAEDRPGYTFPLLLMSVIAALVFLGFGIRSLCGIPAGPTPTGPAPTGATSAIPLTPLFSGLIPVSIAVAGWLVSHALALRAQRQNLQNQVLDRARVEITKGIRDYQNLLSEVSAGIRALNFGMSMVKAGVAFDFQARAEEMAALHQRKRDMRAWSISLENYQILFPETVRARFRLDRRGLKVMMALGPIANDLLRLSLGKPTPEEFQRIITDAEKVLPDIEDLAALLEDLRIHLQNVTLSKIMDRRVPARLPLDPKVPRIAFASDGQLEVVDAEGTVLYSDEIEVGGEKVKV